MLVHGDVKITLSNIGLEFGLWFKGKVLFFVVALVVVVVVVAAAVLWFDSIV